MLIRFAVENFMSFKDSTEFNMSAGKVTRHSEHVVEKQGKRILKGGFLFGANASGKTNLVRAIAFAKSVVIKGLSNVSCDKKYFRIDEAYKTKPGVFQFDLYAGTHFYSYGFALSYVDASIEEEWLYQLDDGEKCIFLRGRREDGTAECSSELTFQDPAQQERLRVYTEDIKNPRMGQTLFLSDMVLRSPDTEEYQPFRDVMGWFKKLIVIFPDSRYGGILKLMENDTARGQFGQLLQYFDTGITAVEYAEREIDKVFADLPEQLVETIKLDLAKGLSEKGDKSALLQKEDHLMELRLRGGNLFADEVVTSHGNKNDLFELTDESDGTRRLFNLIPLYQYARQECVIVIDELDRSLHTKAAIEFVKYFYSSSHNCSAQMIATTHDANIMDLDLLRQDEIWFVERQQDHSSRIYSLNQFKARFDKKVEKDYLLGRYGAIPIFNCFALDDAEGDECDG